MARLEGGPLANTGVIAGMSGSPVYIDGKLLGAVAYGFPFSKETIAGITPIGDMIDATTRHRRAARRLRALPLPDAARRRARRPSTAAMVAPRPVPAQPARRGAARGGMPRSRGQSLAPLALPLIFSGFDAADLRVGAQLVRRRRLRPGDRRLVELGGARRAAARPRAGRRRRRVARRRRHRPVGHRHRDAHRRRPRLRLRPSLLQPRARRSSR